MWLIITATLFIINRVGKALEFNVKLDSSKFTVLTILGSYKRHNCSISLYAQSKIRIYGDCEDIWSHVDNNVGWKEVWDGSWGHLRLDILCDS